MDEVVTGAVAAVGGVLLGALAGYGLRIREQLRADRLKAYRKYLTTLNEIVEEVGNNLRPERASAEYEEMVKRLTPSAREAEVEFDLLASRQVNDASKAVSHLLLEDDEYKILHRDLQSGALTFEAFKSKRKQLFEPRHDVLLAAMRFDLKVHPWRGRWDALKSRFRRR